MVNWKSANIASGVFSVLTFVITAVLFIMYLTKQADAQQAFANVTGNLATATQGLTNRFANASAYAEQQAALNQQSQQILNDEFTQQGGNLQAGTIAALALLGTSLIFHAIIWGLTFGQAKNGYDDD